MRLIQEELLELDSEIAPLRNEKGNFTLLKQFSWMNGRGAINLDEFGRPIIKQIYENGKFLYEVLLDKIEQYFRWRSHGRKVLDISNFGTNEQQNQKQEDKKVAQARLDLSDNFDEDIAAAFG